MRSRNSGQHMYRGLICLIVWQAECSIQNALAEQRSSHVPPRNLPDSFAGEMHEPATYAEAVKSPQAPFWRDAMMKEFEGLRNAGTFAVG